MKLNEKRIQTPQAITVIVLGLATSRQRQRGASREKLLPG